MKKYTSLLIILAILFISCEGPVGPPGEPGDYLIGQTYEIDNVNFTVQNEYTTRFTFPKNIEESDVVLVYRLEDVDQGLDVWEPLPTSTIYFDPTGFLQYRFNFTSGDVDIIVESDDHAALAADFTLDQIFRIVVVPADFANTSGVDLSDMNAVISSLNIEN